MRKGEDKNITEAREMFEEAHAIGVKIVQTTLLAEAGAKCFQSLDLNKCQRNSAWLPLSTCIFLIMGTIGLQLKV